MLSPPGPVPTLVKLADGGNSEVYAWGNDQVLKLFREGFSARAITAEMHHARTAHALGIPTPRVDRIIETNGRTGIIFERCNGQTLYGLIASAAQPMQRLAQILFEVQRAMHRCRTSALPPLTERWVAKIRHARGVGDAVKQRALEILHALPQGESVCHGDFHPANLVMSPSGPMVIDWLDAGRAPAAPDVARTLLLLEFGRPGQLPPAARAAFLAAYRSCWRETWGADFDLVEHWRLPAALARLAEVARDDERLALTRAIEEMAARA